MANRLHLVHKTIFALRVQSQEPTGDFVLAIGDPRYKHEEGEGRIIQQSSSRMYYPEVIFEARDVVPIRRELVLETIEVQCREEPNRYIVSKEEYNRISYEIANDPESSQSQASKDFKEYELSSSDSDEDDEEQLDEDESQIVSRRRGRPKGSKNKRKYMARSDSEREGEESQQVQKRGRGRPKGSKNKKNLKRITEEENRNSFQLKALMNGYLRRGKGRPKGSKNRPKKRTESNQQSVNKEDSHFWKRGKGRPKGSKNKIKVKEQQMYKEEAQESKMKRSRGRPKGVKNKPKSEPSDDYDQSDDYGLFTNNQIGELPEFNSEEDDEQARECCQRCQNRNLKTYLLKLPPGEQKEFLQSHKINNICENIGPERRDNIILNAIASNHKELLKAVLQQLNNRTYYFKSFWDVEGKLEIQKYTVSTLKQGLSRTGKQGIYALLHDCASKKPQPWWKEIGMDKIVESMNNRTDFQILEIMRKDSPDLQTEFYNYIPSLVRSGNSSISYILISQLLDYRNDVYEYSWEHRECLVGGSSSPYKKMNIHKKNSGTKHYCAPIHCAAINPNRDLLENILRSFNNHNISDNIGRKPIHYAAAMSSPENIDLLLRYGSDLRDTDKLKMTPLMISCYYGSSEVTRYILDCFNQPLYVNFRSDEGYSALHYAVLNHHIDCVHVLLSYQSTNINNETKDKQTAMHLAAANGDVDILSLLLSRNAYSDYYDKHKRTPFMMAIRNSNNNIFKILVKLVKLYKADSSLNTMLHYAAAYGNYSALKYLIKIAKQSKNRREYYPWEVAAAKGHIGCARLLDSASATADKAQSEGLSFLALKNMIGNSTMLQLFKYIVQSELQSPDVSGGNGNTLLHICCGLSEDEYIKNRSKQQPSLSVRVLKKQYQYLQESVIDLLLKMGIDVTIENKSKETALIQCIENANYTGIRLLLPKHPSFDINYCTSHGTNLLEYLSIIASYGPEETRFVLDRLQKDKSALKENTNKRDLKGYSPLLYFIRDFCAAARPNFYDKVDAYLSSTMKIGQALFNAYKSALTNYIKHQEVFLNLMKFFVTDLGSDLNVTISAGKSIQSQNSYENFGIAHLLMKFPSLKLLQFFIPKLSNLNATNSQGVTPLHLFCLWNKKGCLFDNYQPENLDEAESGRPANPLPASSYSAHYEGLACLKYLIQNKVNVKAQDCSKSSAILYAALNRQIPFMLQLIKAGCQVNQCNLRNQVPLIEIIKLKDSFTIKEIESLLKAGANPNFQDKNKRTALHHLVYIARNFDNSPELCKLLLDNQAKINALDKFNRTPLFYCFIDIDYSIVQPGKNSTANQNLNTIMNTLPRTNSQDPNQLQAQSDKVDILKVLLSHKDINLNHIDSQRRTALHYACQKDFFFPIMFLTEKKVNLDLQDSSKDKDTPLAICMKNKNLNQIALLVKKGVQKGLVVEDKVVYTYFQYAIEKLSVGVCYLLLDNGYPLQQALKSAENYPQLKNAILKKYSPALRAQ